MEQGRSPEEYATDIGAARDRLVALARRCTDGDWCALLPGSEDLRPVGVIVDHVADAYRYLGDFVRATVEGQPPPVTAALIDEMNAQHASAAAGVTRDDAIAHLHSRGDAYVQLIAGLRAADLDIAEGWIRRFAEIGIRHADSHRLEIETGLSSTMRSPRTARSSSSRRTASAW